MKLGAVTVLDERHGEYTSRKLANSTIPRANLNAVALVAVYTLYGFDDIDICDVTGLSADVLERIRASSDYQSFVDDVSGSVMENEQNGVRAFLLSKSREAANTLVKRLDSKKGAIALRAADSILDRTGHRPVDVHEHRMKMESTLNIRYIETSSRPVTIDAEYEDVRP